VPLSYRGCLLFSLMLKEILPFHGVALVFLQDLVQINLVLAAFNLIPVPPLDGSKILAGLMPGETANFIYRMEQYGPLLLMILIITGTTQIIFRPIVNTLAQIIFMSTGIPY